MLIAAVCFCVRFSCKCSNLGQVKKANNEKFNVIPCKNNSCTKTSFVGSKVDRLCKHDECELKKRLNCCKQYIIFTAFCDFIPKCRSWRIVDAVKDKQKKIKIKTQKPKKTTKTKQTKNCCLAGIRTTIA